MSEQATVETTEELDEKSVTPEDVKSEKSEKTYSESYVKKIHTENAQRRLREKELEERLAAYEKAELDKEKDLEKRAKAERERADKLEQDIAKERAALHKERILSKAESLAVRAGIREDALDDLMLRPELADAKIDDLPEIIDGLKKTKAFWFKSDEPKVEVKPDKARTVTTPERKDGSTSSLDYSKLKEDEFRKTVREKYGVDV